MDGPGRRLLVADPGLSRTYMAGRVTLAVAIALALAFPLADRLGQPSTIAMLAVSVAMVTTNALFGARRPVLLRSAMVAAAVAAAAVTVGAAVAGRPLVGYATFVAIMTTAGGIGRRGPRHFGVGMLGVMSYFLALFTRATLAQLPWLLGAIALGVAVAVVVRLLLLPDRPALRLRWLLVALRARAAVIADAADRARAAPDRAAPSLDRAPARVDAVVLQLHDALTDHPELVGDPLRFQRHLFAVVSLSHFQVLQAQGGAGASTVAHVMPPVDPRQRLHDHLAALETAAAGAEPAPHDEEDAAALREESLIAAAETASIAEEGAKPEAPAIGLSEPVRSALQVAIAGSLAIVVGIQVSPERWYWVAMSAFFVLANTTSRGGTMRKAVERTLGTAGGVAGGLLVGYLLAGRTVVELAVVFPVLFIGFWLLPVSYAAMMAMITIVLALLYDLMGLLTPELLLLRLLDTSIGAAIGMAVAFFLLPARTRSLVGDAFTSYLRALDDLLAAMAAPAGQRAVWEGAVLAAARQLDRAASSLYTTVYPAGVSVPGRRPSALRERMALALAARYWVHRAAARLLFHDGGSDPAPLVPCLNGVRQRVRRLLDGAPDHGAAAEPATGATAESLALLRADAVLAEFARARAAEG